MSALKAPAPALGSCSSASRGLTAALQRLSITPSTSGRRLGLCVEGAWPLRWGYTGRGVSARCLNAQQWLCTVLHLCVCVTCSNRDGFDVRKCKPLSFPWSESQDCACQVHNLHLTLSCLRSVASMPADGRKGKQRLYRCAVVLVCTAQFLSRPSAQLRGVLCLQ